MKREFYLQDDRSNKFWTIEQIGDSVVTHNARIGAKARETRTDYPNAKTAAQALEKDVLAKRRQGYLEGPIDQVPPYTERLPPRLVRINHDDDKAKYVGKTATGIQFFLTCPFAPRMDPDLGGNYIALYLFDQFGALVEARIHDERAEKLITQTAVRAFIDSLLASLGRYTFADIRVSPFAVEKFGRTFGLIFDTGLWTGEDAEDFGLTVTVEPGNYMAFYPPWDGEYDT